MSNNARKFMFLLFAVLVAVAIAGVLIDNIVAKAQTPDSGYINVPYLDHGYHDADDLREAGALLRLSPGTYKIRFIYRGCGFVVTYNSPGDASEVLSIRVDNAEVDTINASSMIDDLYSYWYTTDCGLHLVRVGDWQVFGLSIKGVSIWGADYESAP